MPQTAPLLQALFIGVSANTYLNAKLINLMSSCFEYLENDSTARGILGTQLFRDAILTVVFFFIFLRSVWSFQCETSWNPDYRLLYQAF